MQENLGKIGTCKVSGFKGTITGVAAYLHSGAHFLISAQSVNSALGAEVWLPAARVTLADAETVVITHGSVSSDKPGVVKDKTTGKETKAPKPSADADVAAEKAAAKPEAKPEVKAEAKVVEEAKPAGVPYTDVQAAVGRLAKFGTAKVKAVFATFGLTGKASDLAEDKWGELIAALDEATAENDLA